MSNLISIKNRIGVVGNTKKITNAMELVSTSKLRRVSMQNKNISAYQKQVECVFAHIVTHIDKKTLDSIYPAHENVNGKLFIIITSDLGLCGSYNSNVINHLKSQLTANDYIIIIGQKGVSALYSSKYKEQIKEFYINNGDKLNYEIGNRISKTLFDLYNNKKINSCNIIYTKFINNIVQEVTQKQLFPYDINNEEVEEIKNEKTDALLEIEPDAETVLVSSYPLYIASMVYTLATNSKISELASRRIAMENATDNADEIMKELKLEYNRKRQSNITQEITEIVSGAEATNN